MKKHVLASFVVLFSFVTVTNVFATDLLFVHNGDGVTLKRPGESIIEFSVYSISDKSRIDYVCSGAGGTDLTPMFTISLMSIS
ncbi:MAG: hypothetical protein N2572_06255 [Syntrophales bacterium]|nr:hypothetical protein [Syntrophales bacterium]